MAPALSIQLRSRRRQRWRALTLAGLTAACGVALDSQPSLAQREFVGFPQRVTPPSRPGVNLANPAQSAGEQMLVRATEVQYDHVNERVSAVGNVQIYYSGTSLEADRVIYDQKTKRLHAEGNVRVVEPSGRIVYGDIVDLSDDLRDGFVDSLRVDMPDQTRVAASRGERSDGNFTVFQSGVYTACQACEDDPSRPPKWQVKSARIIHDQGEKMIYFEDATIEFFGMPVAYFPYFATPDPTAKRKTGFLHPTFGSNSRYGGSLIIPYYWALAPNYDFTLTPKITTRQGPLVQGEWRHRLLDGAYRIRASGIFQLDPKAFANTPGDREFRGDVNTAGAFRINDRWTWGWDGTIITDKSYYQDYGFYKYSNTDLLRLTPDYVLSQAYLQGRGTRSFFDARVMYFYGFTTTDDQKSMPIIHPVVNHEYTFDQPVLGGELSIRSNLTSLSREGASFEPVTMASYLNGLCLLNSADPAARTPANCILRGVPGTYTRASTEVAWRRTFVDAIGQVYTPFATVRGDVASVDITAAPGVSNFVTPGQTELARVMPTAGVEYRYPFINVQPWGTQTIEPIAQLLVSPDETHIGALPNESSQSFVFDATNLFRVNKFAGWDRIEGGGRLNAGVQYSIQFNQGGYFNALFGQSYHLFGQNSFAVASPTNTGLNSGLDKPQSDYVASLTYQPNAQITFNSRFRFDEDTFKLQRSEYEGSLRFDRWMASVMYGNYAAQPSLGLLTAREGITGVGKFNLSQNWLAFGGVRYDLVASQLNQTQIGTAYIDDCLILAVNLNTDYSPTGSAVHTVMAQLSLRTIGGTAATQNVSALSQGGTPFGVSIPGLSR